MISGFPHESGPPDLESLEGMLGDANPLWKELVSFLEVESGAKGTWKSYGPKYGWRLDFRRKAGPLAGLYPLSNSILLGINLIQKEWAPAFELQLSNSTKQILESSVPLRDGRFWLIPIESNPAVEDIKALVSLKTGPQNGD